VVVARVALARVGVRLLLLDHFIRHYQTLVERCAYVLCACGCGRQAPPEIALCDAGGAWWRFQCAARSLKGLRCLQNLPPQDLATVVTILRAHGFGLASTVVGALPFDGDDADG